MKKILVVEDDKDILDVVDLVLTSKDFKVFKHNSGNGVLEMVADHKPDLVLLDVQLPGKLGTEVCKELKEIHPIPVLLFSAHSSPEVAFAGCKADGYLAKPFNISELLEKVNRHLLQA